MPTENITNRFLVLDLDESLISSIEAANEKHADQLLDMFSELYPSIKFELSDGWYVSFLRSWSKKLIHHFQNILGIDNVGILTWASEEYAQVIVNQFNLGIGRNLVYAREDLPFRVTRLRDMNIVLVDNESYWFHVMGRDNKIKFMYNAPLEKVVQVPTFDCRYFRPEVDISLENLIKNIDSAFSC